jgi:hypothetical protein
MFSINKFMVQNKFPKEFKIRVRNYLVFLLVSSTYY